MGIVITPYAEEHVAAVKAFNARLRSGGAELLFPESPVPAWLPKLDGREIYDEYYVAVENGAVHGGYILKYQPFYVGGRLMPLVQYRLPLSEGFIDKQFAPVGVQMYLDAIRKAPNLYTVGLGGYDDPFAQLLMKAGWSTSSVPFYFRVLHPARFLRNIVYLRTSASRRFILNAMAASGLGAIAIHAYQALKTRKAIRDRSHAEFTEEPSFGPWADEIWNKSHADYSLVALRDATILNILYPADEPRWHRLKVSFEGRVVGWAVVLCVPMEDHNYFGNMRVGSLIDCMALPGSESKVTNVAMQFLKRQGADIVVTNLSHQAWRPALEAAGFYQGPSNFIFAASKKVAALLEPFDQCKEGVHMTRGDGAGPQNLIAARK